MEKEENQKYFATNGNRPPEKIISATPSTNLDQDIVTAYYSDQQKVEARERRIESRALLTGEGCSNRTVREVRGSIEQEN